MKENGMFRWKPDCKPCRIRALVVIVGMLICTGSLFANSLIAQTAADYIKVGEKLLDRGLYLQAEESLLRARDYEEHLPESQIQMMYRLLDKARVSGKKQAKAGEMLETARSKADSGQDRIALQMLNTIEIDYLTKGQQKYLSNLRAGIEESIRQEVQLVESYWHDFMTAFQQGDFEQAQGIVTQLESMVSAKLQMQPIAIEEITAVEEPTEMEPETVWQSPDTISDSEPAEAVIVEEEQPEQVAEGALMQDILVMEDETSAGENADSAGDNGNNIVIGYLEAVVTQAEENVKKMVNLGDLEAAATELLQAENVFEAHQDRLDTEQKATYQNRLMKLADRIADEKNTTER